MFKFVESPIFNNWFADENRLPQRSLLICTPYIKQEALDKLFRTCDIEANSTSLQIKVLIRGNLEEFTTSRSSDISTLDTFLSLNGFDISNFRRIKNLHMKAYLIDETDLLITSGNLTNSGMFAITGRENFEGGIATNDPTIIREFLGYFNHIWDQSEGLDSFYDTLIDGYRRYVEETPARRPRSSRTRYRFREGVTADNFTENSRLTLSDLPSARIDTLLKTLETLKESESPLTMYARGQALRRQERCDNLDDDFSNRKYGEEKGNLAVYFGLATKRMSDDRRVFEYALTSMGRYYLDFTIQERFNYLSAQVGARDTIVDIWARSQIDGFNLRRFIFENTENAARSTLSRKIASTKDLIDICNGVIPQGL